MNSFTTEKFIQRSEIKHNFRYDYSLVEYKAAKIKVIIICPEHGEFEQTPDKHLMGRGCSQCGILKCAESQTSTSQEFISKAIVIHNQQYDYSLVEYITAINKVKIICHKHGQFFQTPNNHLAGNGCPECKIDTIVAARTLPLNVVLETCKNIHNNYYDYSKTIYVNQKTKIEIICYKHGSFWQTPNSHSQGQGCPKCHKRVSNKETKWLDQLNIPNDKYHRQVSIQIGHKTIQVDGFDPETNTIYEFYGDFWHGNPKKYKPEEYNWMNKQKFGELYKETIDRENLIKTAGFNLIVKWEDYFPLPKKNFNASTTSDLSAVL